MKHSGRETSSDKYSVPEICIGQARLEEGDMGQTRFREQCILQIFMCPREKSFVCGAQLQRCPSCPRLRSQIRCFFKPDSNSLRSSWSSGDVPCPSCHVTIVLALVSKWKSSGHHSSDCGSWARPDWQQIRIPITPYFAAHSRNTLMFPCFTVDIRTRPGLLLAVPK